MAEASQYSHVLHKDTDLVEHVFTREINVVAMRSIGWTFALGWIFIRVHRSRVEGDQDTVRLQEYLAVDVINTCWQRKGLFHETSRCCCPVAGVMFWRGRLEPLNVRRKRLTMRDVQDFVSPPLHDHDECQNLLICTYQNDGDTRGWLLWCESIHEFRCFSAPSPVYEFAYQL